MRCSVPHCAGWRRATPGPKRRAISVTVPVQRSSAARCIAPGTRVRLLMMAWGDARGAIRNPDFHVLHHALIFMVEDVTVQDKLADVALIARANLDGVHRGCKLAREITRTCDQILYPERVLPYVFQARILRIGAAGIVDGAGQAHVFPARIGDGNDLDAIAVGGERMADETGLQRPFVDPAELQHPVDPLGIVRLRVELRRIEMLRIDRLVSDPKGYDRLFRPQRRLNLDEEHKLLFAGDLGVGDVGMRNEALELQSVAKLRRNLVPYVGRENPERHR